MGEPNPALVVALRRAVPTGTANAVKVSHLATTFATYRPSYIRQILARLVRSGTVEMRRGVDPLRAQPVNFYWRKP